MRSMRARHQQTSRLSFCCAAAQLDNEYDPERRRSALFELAERYLGLREQLHAREVEKLVHEQSRELLNELSQREFGHFLASRQCSELIHQLRLIDAPNLHLTPPLTPDAANERGERLTDELVCVMDAALRDFPAAVLLCDRTLGGLPIVSCSAGVQRLTGYDPHEMLGWNCRILQGPETEQSAIAVMVDAIRTGQAIEVSITNYRKDGRPFTNQVSLSKTLAVLPGTELIAAVLREPPPPLQAARFDAETAELISVLASCNTLHSEATEMAQDSGLSPKAVEEGEQWMLDAEGTLNRILRLQPVRSIFLRVALQGGDANHRAGHYSLRSSLESSGGTAGAMDQTLLTQEVQLMMHSENVLCEREHYLQNAISLWSEMQELNRVEGWEYRAALSALAKRYILPDRGSRRHSTLWRGLRTVIYDPMSVRERELRDATSDEQPTTASLRDAMRIQERRRPLELTRIVRRPRRSRCYRRARPSPSWTPTMTSMTAPSRRWPPTSCRPMSCSRWR